MKTKTQKQEGNKDRIDIRLPKKVKEKYKNYCSKNKLVLSERIRLFIEADIKGEIKQF